MLHKRGCHGRYELLSFLFLIIHSLLFISPFFSPSPASLLPFLPPSCSSYFSSLHSIFHLPLLSGRSFRSFLLPPSSSLPSLFPSSILPPSPPLPADDVFSYYRGRLRGERERDEGGRLDKREGGKGSMDEGGSEDERVRWGRMEGRWGRGGARGRERRNDEVRNGRISLCRQLKRGRCTSPIKP